MPAKTDRRTERTRHALMAAFVQEVLTRGYDEITVEEIAARANVGRSTFYMHYKSKEGLLKESISRPSSILAVLVGGDISSAMLVPQLKHFHDQRARNGTFFRDPVRKVWVKRLADMIEPRLTKVVRHTRARPALPIALIAMQIAEAQIALVTNWLTTRPNIDPEAIAGALIGTTRAALQALLGVAPGTVLLIPGEKLRVIYAES